MGKWRWEADRTAIICSPLCGPPTQSDLDRPEERANRNLMTFNKDKCKACTSDRLNPCTVQAGASLAGSNSPGGRDLVSSRLQRSQHHALGAMKVNSVLGCVNRTIASR